MAITGLKSSYCCPLVNWDEYNLSDRLYILLVAPDEQHVLKLFASKNIK